MTSCQIHYLSVLFCLPLPSQSPNNSWDQGDQRDQLFSKGIRRSQKLQTLLHDASSRACSKPGDSALTAAGGWRTRVRFQGRPTPDKAPGRQATFSQDPAPTLTLQSYRHTVIRIINLPSKDDFYSYLLPSEETKPLPRQFPVPFPDTQPFFGPTGTAWMYRRTAPGCATRQLRILPKMQSPYIPRR